jgi:hypothetical protein
MIKLINLRSQLIFNVAVFILFILITFAMTFPLFLKINSAIAGFFSTDEPSIWYLWWLKYAFMHKISYIHCPLIGVPFGVDFSFFQQAYPLWIQIKRFLTITFNEYFCYNLEIISGFVLSGFFMYLLVKYLFKNRPAAIFSGIIFAFCPYHFARAWQHIGLAHTQWLVLYLYRLFKLKESQSKKNILWLFLSLYLVFAFDLYYAYFAMVISAAFLIWVLFKEKRLFLRLLLCITIANLFNCIILYTNIAPVISSLKTQHSQAGAWNYIRPFEDLFAQSARPLSYFLPSPLHPLFGRFTEQFVGSAIYGQSFTEHAIYLGWAPLILSFIAIYRWRRPRFAYLGSGVKNSDIGFFVFFAIFTWLFSQPPWWNVFGFKVYMPTFVIYKIVPVFRASCRFGILVMLAVAVLAGLGLKFMLENSIGKAKKATIVLLCNGLVLFEFWNYPPYKVIDMSRVPAAYYWLRNEPGDFVVAEYPLDASPPKEIYKFYQTRHLKRIINGTLPGTKANKVAQEIIKLSEPKAAGILRWMGVKYVLVHHQDYLNTELVSDKEELEKISKDTKLKLIKSFPAEYCFKDALCTCESGEIDVYEVLAEPIKPNIKD